MKKLIPVTLGLFLYQCCSAQDSTRTNFSAGITISLPWASSYHYYDYELNKTAGKSGFFGLGLAFFYKTEKHKFSLNTGITSDLAAPVGPVDYEPQGTRTSLNAFYTELLYHHRLLKRLNLAGGVQVTGYRFSFISYENITPRYTMLDYSAGLTTGLEFLMRKNASAALFYRPGFFSFGRKQYWHHLSLDFRFDINLIRK